MVTIVTVRGAIDSQILATAVALSAYVIGCGQKFMRRSEIHKPRKPLAAVSIRDLSL
jgi:hypothetical protein